MYYNGLKKSYVTRTSFTGYAFLIITLICTLCPLQIYSQKASSSIVAGEQKKAEKGLKDNRLFIYYLDSTIVNCANETETNLFVDAVKHDLVAQFYYLRFSFTDSFREIRITQKLLIDIYVRLIDSELKETKIFLNSFASKVINSQDQKASLYLRLAYRNLAVCRQEKIMADNYKKSLYSLRLHKYVKSMISLKEAKRYGVAAYLQSIEPAKLNLHQGHFSFDFIMKIIDDNAEPEYKETMKVMHYDSYYMFKTNESVHAKIWDDPQLDEYEPYRKYLEKSE